MPTRLSPLALKRALTPLPILTLLTSLLLASAASPPRRLSRQDLDEVTSRIFPPHQPVFANSDGWTSLSFHEREAWTFANSRLPGTRPFTSARGALAGQKPILVPVRVVVVDPGGAAPLPAGFSLESVQRAMRAGFAVNANGSGLSPGTAAGAESGGVTAKVLLEVAPDALAKRIAAAGRGGAAALRKVLQAVYMETATWRDVNVLFALVGLEGKKLDLPRDSVQLGRGRLSWVRCHATKKFLDVVNVAEAAVATVYVPPPNHFPVAVTEQVRIDIHPYTPGLEHRALWYLQFDWDAFQAAVRSLAAPGQTMGFFSTQSTGECGALFCDEAFRDLQKVYADGGKQAAFVLNHHAVPSNLSWSVVPGMKKSEDAERMDPEFDVYILDSARVAGGIDKIKLSSWATVAGLTWYSELHKLARPIYKREEFSPHSNLPKKHARSPHNCCRWLGAAPSPHICCRWLGAAPKIVRHMYAWLKMTSTSFSV